MDCKLYFGRIPPLLENLFDFIIKKTEKNLKTDILNQVFFGCFEINQPRCKNIHHKIKTQRRTGSSKYLKNEWHFG
jgi:hypothetical protein